MYAAFAKPQERRISVRRMINAPGEITVVSRRLSAQTVRCTVVNVSESGALLEGRLGALPDQFYLSYRDGPMARHTCFVIRRDGTYRAAVRFV